VRIWDLTSTSVKDLAVIEGELPVRSMAISNNREFLVAGTGEGTCFIWRSENGTGDNYIPM
jgi:WD40 repeat protein